MKKFQTIVPSDENRRRIHFLFLVWSIFLCLGVIYYIIIKLLGRGIPCFYESTLGILCPGCGTTRMFLSLASFDFKSAFYYNPVMLLSLPVLLSIAFIESVRYVKGKSFRKISKILLIAIGIAFLIFGIVRNL